MAASWRGKLLGKFRIGLTFWRGMLNKLAAMGPYFMKTIMNQDTASCWWPTHSEFYAGSSRRQCNITFEETTSDAQTRHDGKWKVKTEDVVDVFQAYFGNFDWHFDKMFSYDLMGSHFSNKGTNYATCVICKEQGHLSKDCPKNAHGIYPMGELCKLCGGVTHLVRDCPNKDNRNVARIQVTYFTIRRGKDHGEYILQSIDEGLFKMGRCRDEIASGLTRDIYKLINHNTDAKDIWDNVKMLLEGSELTKDGRESQLYDEFEHFRQHKGENIDDYYVRFTKVINDMRHIKMTMPKFQLNSKFVNNMLLEWGRFVTAVKLNKGLKESNHYQLYAYLKQHESHANKNKMLMERLNQHSHDPLALVSNALPYQYPSSSSVSSQSSYILSVTYQPQVVVQNVQGRQNRVQGNNVRGNVAAGNRGAQKTAATNCNQPKRPQNSNYFKEKMLLMQAQENRVDLDEKQLLFLAGVQTNTFDDDVDKGPIQDMAQNKDNIFQADQCDAFDSDVDEAPTAQTMFMANLSSAAPVYDKAGPSYDSDTLSEYVQDNEAQLVQSDASSVPNDTVMMVTNDIYEQDVLWKMKCVTVPAEKPKVLAPGMYAIDVEQIPPRNRNNREVHLDYLKNLKESVVTLREIVEEARVEKPLDSLLVSAYRYIKHSQELFEYVIGTCPKDFNARDKKLASTPFTKKKKVTFKEPYETSTHNTPTHPEQ
nr:DNA-binding protein HEXBP [Tanacetum cinerariifolium]